MEDVLQKQESEPVFSVASRPYAARPRSARPRGSKDGETPVVCEMEGCFWFEKSHTTLVNDKKVHKGILHRERQQLREIVKTGFFTDSILQDVVVKLNDETSSAPRLRAYDWAVTNYAKGNPLIMLIKEKDGRAALVDPNLSYQGELRRHHRLLFDPFRRGTHVYFETYGQVHRTTVGQLTFIKWCLDNGVHKYVEDHLASIREHMAKATKRRRQATTEDSKKRRRELTKAPVKVVRGVMLTSFDIMTDAEKELKST
jgi:hypothetical protein